ncbi:hypothetical protein PAT3040_06154 [Paenibacillus agaridevorans]|uniref:Uncharacterized protein n=1 Tax=Paenibacillus agaridevorans TaxID=171404 RepID=A0A2R5F456_9BACL|nr:hypothetical protein PAT3040_06154 [Paenibacillus agaridevorans]
MHKCAEMPMFGPCHVQTNPSERYPVDSDKVAYSFSCIDSCIEGLEGLLIHACRDTPNVCENPVMFMLFGDT